MARVIVVGAGVVGLAAAWRLTNDGHEVTIVDPDPASGASRAAAGMLAAVSEYHYHEDALLELTRCSAAGYPALVAGLRAATGQDPGYRTTGTITVGADRADRDWLAGLRAAQLAHGLNVRSMTTAQARTAEPALSPRIAGAFLGVDDHQIDPRRLTGCYLTALACRAVLVRRTATALRWDGERVTGIMMGDEPLDADEVIMATAVGTARLDQLPPGWAVPIRPVHGDVLRLRMPPGDPLITHTVRGLVHGRAVYLVPRADGELVIGATEREDGRPGVSAGGVLRLLHDAQELLPDVAELDLVEALARPRPGTPDNAPLVGRVTPGLIADTGTYRHGVLISLGCAQIVSAAVAGVAPPQGFEAFDPWRFSDRSDSALASAAATRP